MTEPTRPHEVAIIRLDTERLNNWASLNDDQRTTAITIVNIVDSHDRAEEEVRRLNELNGAKGCQYIAVYARRR
jgi:hypothetical protein